MARRWHLALILVTLTCLSFYLNLQSRVQNIHWSRRENMKLPEADCLHLKSLILTSTTNKLKDSQFFPVIKALQGCLWMEEHTARELVQNQDDHKSLSPTKCAAIRGIILMKSLKRIKTKTFIQYMNDLQRCPWEYNQTEHHLLKLKFGSCCNASHTLIVTQQNAPLGHVLQYETSMKKVTVNEKVYQLLPKKSPFAKPFDTCAVVGNGGILLNSSCGSEIDKMDYVFRFNLPPMTIAHDIGTKTNFVSANPSILTKRFQQLYNNRRPFINLVKGFGSAMIVLPAFSYEHNTAVSFRVLHSVQDFDLPNKVVFFHPGYLRNLSMYWNERGLKVKRLSSGLMLVSAAIELCEKVTLFGFWPFSQDPKGNAIPHHYYDNIMPKPGFHSMPQEFHFYTKMHLNGMLHLKIGQCS